MFGFALGILCVIGLKRALRGSRCGGGGGGGGGPSFRRGRRWGRRGYRRWFMWRVLEQLDTSPGQEKVIRAEVDTLIEHVYGLKRTVRASADDIARAIRGEAFDDGAAGEAFATQDAALRELREAAQAALKRIHEALDPEQRERLADILESGGLRGGPYRGWA